MLLIFVLKVGFFLTSSLSSRFLVILPSNFMKEKVYTPELLQHPSLKC